MSTHVDVGGQATMSNKGKTEGNVWHQLQARGKANFIPHLESVYRNVTILHQFPKLPVREAWSQSGGLALLPPMTVSLFRLRVHRTVNKLNGILEGIWANFIKINAFVSFEVCLLLDVYSLV